MFARRLVLTLAVSLALLGVAPASALATYPGANGDISAVDLIR